MQMEMHIAANCVRIQVLLPVWMLAHLDEMYDASTHSDTHTKC